MQIMSPAFANLSQIPAKYTCDAEEVSPPLTFAAVPQHAKSLVLIVDDPDAPSGTWDHWLVYNLPPTTKGLAQGATELPPEVKMGVNSWGRSEYGGPCPPSGTHRYFFKLYAIDKMLNFSSAPSKKELLQAINGHVLAEASMMGTYQRHR